MDASLRVFISQFIGAVSAALALVFVIAFLSMPMSLGGHPGEPRPADRAAGQHLS